MAKTRVLLMIAIMAVISMLGAGAINALDIIFVTRSLHTSAALYGPLVATSGIGVLLGAIGVGLLSKRIKPQRILTGGVLFLGMGIVIYSLQAQYLASLIISFIMSIPQEGIDVGFGSLLINTTPQRLMGRAQSVIETSMYGASLLSIALVGYLGQLLPVNLILTGCGILLALGGLFSWFALPWTITKVEV